LSDGQYHYYEISGAPEHEDDPNAESSSKSFLLRIGKFVDEAGRLTIKYQMCEEDAQREDFEASEVDEGRLKVFTAHKFSFQDQDNVVHEGQGSIEIDATGKKVVKDKKTTIEVENAEITGAFKDEFGCGSINVSFDTVTPLNSMTGYFEGNFGEFSHKGGVCVFEANKQGSGRGEFTASFLPFVPPNQSVGYCPSGPNTPPTQVSSTTTACPEQTFSHSESFEITSEGAIIDETPDATLVELANNCTLDGSCSSPSDFNEAWDCTAPDGFVEIDMSQIDVSECEKFNEEKHDPKSCEQEDFKEDQQEGTN